MSPLSRIMGIAVTFSVAISLGEGMFNDDDNYGGTYSGDDDLARWMAHSSQEVGVDTSSQYVQPPPPHPYEQNPTATPYYGVQNMEAEYQNQPEFYPENPDQGNSQFYYGMPEQVKPELYSDMPIEAKQEMYSNQSYYGESSQTQHEVQQDEVTTKGMSQGEYNKARSREHDSLIPYYCSLDINQLPENHGLITDATGKNILYPLFHDYVQMTDGQEILIMCSGSDSFLMLNNQDLQLPFIELKCTQGMLFSYVLNRHLELHEYACGGKSTPVLKKLGQSTLCKGSGNGMELNHFLLGINLGNLFFHKTHDLCAFFKDQENKSVEFIVSHLNYLGGQETGFSRSQDQYDASVGRLLDPNTTRTVLQEQLGLQRYQRLTHGMDSQYYIVPGHVAGKYDHVYRIEQLSAYHSATLKPMWSNLEKNWTAIEKAISRLAAKKLGLTVISGTFGKMSFWGRKSEETSLYIGKKANGAYQQAIPYVFYKFIEDRYGACVVLLGHNTPRKVDLQHKMCTDITDQIVWLQDFLKTGIEYGIVYACNCHDFTGNRYIPADLLRKTRVLKS